MTLWSMDDWRYVERQVVTDPKGRQWSVALMDVLGQDGDPEMPSEWLELQYASGRYFTLIYSTTGALQWERGHATLPEAATATLSRAETAGLLVELVALDPGERPDWDEARRYIDALVLEEIEDDLLELCGVDPARDPRETWLETVKERLRADLESFRGDIEGDLDEIEEWDFLDGRIFAAVGSFDDQADPLSGFGWLCRLVDAGALAAAGFQRVRKAELQRAE